MIVSVTPVSSTQDEHRHESRCKNRRVLFRAVVSAPIKTPVFKRVEKSSAAIRALSSNPPRSCAFCANEKSGRDCTPAAPRFVSLGLLLHRGSRLGHRLRDCRPGMPGDSCRCDEATSDGAASHLNGCCRFLHCQYLLTCCDYSQQERGYDSDSTIQQLRLSLCCRFESSLQVPKSLA